MLLFFSYFRASQPDPIKCEKKKWFDTTEKNKTQFSFLY